MSITLTYGAVTEALSDRLLWANEYEWSPVEQSTEYSLNGALVVDVGVMLAGQPIVLDGADTNAWITRALCDTLKGWAASPGAEFALVLRGVTYPVIFDHAKGGFSAEPIWKLADGEITPELFYRPSFKFLTV